MGRTCGTTRHRRNLARSLSRAERAREMLLMGLRVREGIDPARFATRTGLPLQDALDPTILAAAVDEAT